MGKPIEQTSQVTSVDVAYLLRDMDDTHFGHTVIELRVLPTRNARYVRFAVVAANFVGTHRSARNTRAVVTRAWPSAGHRTLAGLMVRLLHELSAELDQLRATPRGGVTPLEAAINAAVITDNPQD